MACFCLEQRNQRVAVAGSSARAAILGTLKTVSASSSLGVRRLAVIVFRADGHADSRATVSSATGWAGSSTRAAIAASALTPAATRQAAPKPWKNAVDAAA